MDTSRLSIDLVKKIAELAKLPLDEKNFSILQKQLESSLTYINKIQSLDTSNARETSQVTGLENIFREDEVNKKRNLTQQESLSGSTAIYKGYFKVKAIFDEE